MPSFEEHFDTIEVPLGCLLSLVTGYAVSLRCAGNGSCHSFGGPRMLGFPAYDVVMRVRPFGCANPGTHLSGKRLSGLKAIIYQLPITFDNTHRPVSE